MLNPSETGLEITCNNESYGFLKTSSAGVYGSCGAEALRDDSGFKLVCGGDSVGVVYNGKAGRNGVNGDNGLNGQNGENGTSCEAKKVESGFELFCGEKKVGLIPNGHSCTVSKTDGASVISCEDGTEAVHMLLSPAERRLLKFMMVPRVSRANRVNLAKTALFPRTRRRA